MNEEIKNAKPATEREPRSKHVIEAETSDGPRVAKTENEIDADDLRDVVDRGKPAKKTPIDDRPKQPAYLKSVAQPIVPTTNPEAPFGYDENDRPIGIVVGKPYIRPELKAVQEQPSSGLVPCGGCGQQMCRHCHPENNVQTDVLKPTASVLDLEENLRRQLGLPSPLTSTVAAAPKRDFNFYPEILGITRQQLIELFDAVVETKTEIVRLMETRLKNTAFVRQQIAGLNTSLTHWNKRLQCVSLLIQRSELLTKSWSAQVMKKGVKRVDGTWVIEPRPEDNILDQRTREKYKYEEGKKLEKFKRWKVTVKTKAENIRTHLDELQQRLDNWGSNPDDLEVVTVTKDRDVTFKETFREPKEPINDLSDAYAKLRQLDPNISKVDAYISLLSTEYQGLSELSRRHRLLYPWRWFENEVVLQAIGHGLIRPTKKAFETYSHLKKYLNQNAWSEDDIEIDRSAEEGLIAKTGGAQIGASIYNFGLTRKGQPRLSGSFDATVGYANKDTGTNGPGGSASWAGEIDSGDYAEEIASE